MTLFSLTGNVIRGNQLGRKLGYPTANIEFGNHPGGLVEKTGIYAATIDIRGSAFRGVASIGYRPTIVNSSFSVEVHIFDFAEEIYDQTITIHFEKRLRDERKFDTLEALVVQMGRDAEQAKLFFG